MIKLEIWIDVKRFLGSLLLKPIGPKLKLKSSYLTLHRWDSDKFLFAHKPSENVGIYIFSSRVHESTVN